jgi:hypothetical protein
MSLLKAPGGWSTSHLYRRTSTNERVVTVVKLTHPTRQQRVVVIPCPRVGLESFYLDWAYQPYLKEHQLLLNFDIYHPAYFFGGRLLMDRNKEKFAGIKGFSVLRMPGPGEQDVTRAALRKRTFFSRPSIIAQTFTTAAYRDRKTNYTKKILLQMIGDKYLTHPTREADGSFVLLLPPCHAAGAMQVLGDLGFEVADTTDALIGDADKIEAVEKYCRMGEALWLAYVWCNLIMAIWYISTWLYEKMTAFRDEYYANRTQKIEKLVSDGFLTRAEADELLSKVAK